MNYFDDIRFLSVDRVVSRRNGKGISPHNYWGVGLMQGEGEVKAISSDGREKRCKMPFLYLIRPSSGGGGAWGVVDGAERDNRWVIVQGPRAERMINSLVQLCPGGPGSTCIYLKSYRELISIHQRMLYLFQRNIPSKSYRLAVCLEEFAGAVYDALAVTRQSSPAFHFAEQVAEMISADPGAVYDFGELARKRHISGDHFRRCFQEYAGKPVYEFLLEKRLALAENLLRGSTDSIKEISERCGFPRQAEFARFIKHRTGITPSELRKRPGLDSE